MMAFLLACPFCFGAADSDQVHAAKIGVLVLLGFIVPILLAIGLIARSWAKRARELDAAEAGNLVKLGSELVPGRVHARQA